MTALGQWLRPHSAKCADFSLWQRLGVIGCRVFPARGEEFEGAAVARAGQRTSHAHGPYLALLVRSKSAARRIVFPSPPESPLVAHPLPYVLRELDFCMCLLACERSH